MLPLLRGMLFAQGRRTVARWLRAADLGKDFRPYYYFLGSLGPKAGVIAAVLLRRAVGVIRFLKAGSDLIKTEVLQTGDDVFPKHPVSKRPRAAAKSRKPSRNALPKPAPKPASMPLRPNSKRRVSA